MQCAAVVISRQERRLVASVGIRGLPSWCQGHQMRAMTPWNAAMGLQLLPACSPRPCAPSYRRVTRARTLGNSSTSFLGAALAGSRVHGQTRSHHLLPRHPRPSRSIDCLRVLLVI